MGVFSNLHKTRNTGSKRSSSKSSRSSSKSRGVQKVSYYEGNDVVRSYEKGGIRYGVKKDGSLVRVAPSKKVVVGFTRDSKTGKVVDTLKDANEQSKQAIIDAQKRGEKTVVTKATRGSDGSLSATEVAFINRESQRQAMQQQAQRRQAEKEFLEATQGMTAKQFYDQYNVKVQSGGRVTVKPRQLQPTKESFNPNNPSTLDFSSTSSFAQESALKGVGGGSAKKTTNISKGADGYFYTIPAPFPLKPSSMSDNEIKLSTEPKIDLSVDSDRLQILSYIKPDKESIDWLNREIDKTNYRTDVALKRDTTTEMFAGIKEADPKYYDINVAGQRAEQNIINFQAKEDAKTFAIGVGATIVTAGVGSIASGIAIGTQTARGLVISRGVAKGLQVAYAGTVAYRGGKIALDYDPKNPSATFYKARNLFAETTGVALGTGIVASRTINPNTYKQVGSTKSYTNTDGSTTFIERGRVLTRGGQTRNVVTRLGVDKTGQGQFISRYKTIGGKKVLTQTGSVNKLSFKAEPIKQFSTTPYKPSNFQQTDFLKVLNNKGQTYFMDAKNLKLEIKNPLSLQKAISPYDSISNNFVSVTGRQGIQSSVYQTSQNILLKQQSSLYSKGLQQQILSGKGFQYKPSSLQNTILKQKDLFKTVVSSSDDFSTALIQQPKKAPLFEYFKGSSIIKSTSFKGLDRTTISQSNKFIGSKKFNAFDFILEYGTVTGSRGTSSFGNFAGAQEFVQTPSKPSTIAFKNIITQQPSFVKTSNMGFATSKTIPTASTLGVPMVSFSTQKTSLGVEAPSTPSPLNLFEAEFQARTEPINQAEAVSQTIPKVDTVTNSGSSSKTSGEAGTQTEPIVDPVVEPIVDPQIQEPFEITPSRPPIPQPIIPPPVPLPRINLPNKKGFLEPLFDVEVRRRGRFEKANFESLSRRQALDFGSAIIDMTSTATFRVVPKSSRSASKEFADFSIEDTKGSFKRTRGKIKKKQGLFIEKKQYRIDTEGEFSEITLKGLGKIKGVTL